jgi:tripartite-type tricarboxylate transporter receptor subunit TctC
MPSLHAPGADLIVYTKANPSRVNYGSSGVGAASHLAGAPFNSLASTRVEHVTYRGVGPAITDVLAGQIPFIFAPAPPSLPQIADGKLGALGVTTAERSRLFPPVPAIAESGLPGYDAVGWFRLLGPTGIPALLAGQLNTTLRAQLGSAEVKAKFADMGAEPGEMSPEQFATVLNADIAKWARVIAADWSRRRPLAAEVGKKLRGGRGFLWPCRVGERSQGEQACGACLQAHHSTGIGTA